MMWLPEAFPAVTVPVPSLTKAGLSFCSASIEHPCLGNSSLFTTSGRKITICLSRFSWFNLTQDILFTLVDFQQFILFIITLFWGFFYRKSKEQNQ